MTLMRSVLIHLTSNKWDRMNFIPSPGHGMRLIMTNFFPAFFEFSSLPSTAKLGKAHEREIGSNGRRGEESQAVSGWGPSQVRYEDYVKSHAFISLQRWFRLNSTLFIFYFVNSILCRWMVVWEEFKEDNFPPAANQRLKSSIAGSLRNQILRK